MEVEYSLSNLYNLPGTDLGMEPESTGTRRLNEMTLPSSSLLQSSASHLFYKTRRYRTKQDKS